MKIMRFSVEGFQSFAKSKEITLGPGFNIIIGQNNSGKSSLLRSLTVPLQHDQHRSETAWSASQLPKPVIRFTARINIDDLQSGIFRLGQSVMVPIPDHATFNSFLDIFWDREFIDFELIRYALSSSTSVTYPSHGLFVADLGRARSAVNFQVDNGQLQNSPPLYVDTDSLPMLIDSIWQTEVFFFTAERMSIGESAYGFADRLTSNANNLPLVLLDLSGTKGDKFAKLVHHLRDIFPSVGNLSVAPTSRNSIEVRVWPTASMKRPELSFPLNTSGTGVAQVIAILTAIMTLDNAVIVIDEINSFLHPSATKALLRIIQTDYSSHQYIISTHSPEVISFGNLSTVHLVKRVGYESHVQAVDVAKLDDLRDVADHLGISMTDVFASERIIWVEGPSEEIIFPYIYQQLGSNPFLPGVKFASVSSTGDFNRKRDKEIVYEVYRRISSATTPLVRSVLVSFDTEQLTAHEKLSMTRDSGGFLRFLPRRNLECYMLDASAISEFIVRRHPESADVATVGNVSSKMGELANQDQFRIPEWKGDLNDIDWLSKVDAAKLISKVVSEISCNCVVFNKKQDSLELVQLIIATDSTKMQPLYDYVSSLVSEILKI